jgi:hypothetical protein
MSSIDNIRILFFIIPDPRSAFIEEKTYQGNDNRFTQIFLS